MKVPGYRKGKNQDSQRDLVRDTDEGAHLGSYDWLEDSVQPFSVFKIHF